MVFAKSPIHAHRAEADSDIFIGVGRNGSMSGVKVTDDAYLVTVAGISKLAFLVKNVRISFAPAGIEEEKFLGGIVFRMPLLSS